MGKRLRRLLAAALALLLALGCLSFAGAEDDWREQLRKLYGLTDDVQTDQKSESTKEDKAAFQLPVTDPQQIVNYLGAYGKLPENVGFLSVTVDDPGDLKDAQALLEQYGCAFPCVDGQGSEGLVKSLLSRVMAIPTTVFFDRAGNEVGDWIVGVPQGKGSVSDAYLNEIQARLDLVNGK